MQRIPKPMPVKIHSSTHSVVGQSFAALVAAVCLVGCTPGDVTAAASDGAGAADSGFPDATFDSSARPDLTISPGATVVSFTFDDSFTSHMLAAQMLEKHGMRGTFYVILGGLGGELHLSVEQVLDLSERGHEIGAHTFSHPHLPQIPLDEVKRELCDARIAMRQLDLSVESLAYPFGETNPDVEKAAEECGYSSARDVNGLYAEDTCPDCPISQKLPVNDRFRIPSPQSASLATTLETLQNSVLKAEQNGGGWLPFVFHRVCNDCEQNSVSPEVLAAFIAWIDERNTLVATVDQIIGGPTKPLVPGPDPARMVSTTQMLANPSLEDWVDPLAAPTCWQRVSADVGETFQREQAADGGWAEHIKVAPTQGKKIRARLVSSLDMGSCAPPAQPGQSFRFRAKYKGSALAMPVAYYRTELGDWISWDQGKNIKPSDTWTDVVWLTPPLPQGARAVSFGLALKSEGEGTFDDFGLSLNK